MLASPPPATLALSGQVYDGYLSQCTLYLDVNGDSQVQNGTEPTGSSSYASSASPQGWQLTLSSSLSSALSTSSIRVLPNNGLNGTNRTTDFADGCYDIATNFKLTLQLSMPAACAITTTTTAGGDVAIVPRANGGMISPLSSVLSHMVAIAPAGTSLVALKVTLLEAVGLNASATPALCEIDSYSASLNNFLSPGGQLYVQEQAVMSSATTLCNFVAPKSLADLPSCAELMLRQMAARALNSSSALANATAAAAAAAGRRLGSRRLSGLTHDVAAGSIDGGAPVTATSRHLLQSTGGGGGALDLTNPAVLAALLDQVAAEALAGALPASAVNREALTDPARRASVADAVGRAVALQGAATSLAALLQTAMTSTGYLADEVQSLALASAAESAAAIASFTNATSSAALEAQARATTVPGVINPGGTPEGVRLNSPPPPPPPPNAPSSTDSGGGGGGLSTGDKVAIGIMVPVGVFLIAGAAAGTAVAVRRRRRRARYDVTGGAAGAAAPAAGMGPGADPEAAGYAPPPLQQAAGAPAGATVGQTV
ncbi:hypothetical protein HYH03_003964 [Edaphochlamys debaryana]|uniref:Uncharacterized protein n=1 Tax=Edaphochlamys debaryana TaxID=47281 RepID=A0A835Y8X3_9CHLO|nr:hypothetical protein HYH03_003964 [Edaphochlamys debaryana]|eukprot:KAG2498213.1 hypothetical protein HYH03_003964 [Edaphochlamys debaryana]